MKIAIWGDLHGRVLLPFYLISRWQQEHGEAIDCALCVGDVGIYRGLESMEKTSKRFARNFPEELGFSKFFLNYDLSDMKLKPHPVVDGLLEGNSLQLFAVPGNHEEHQYLGDIWLNYAKSAADPITVDCDWHGIEKGIYEEGEFSGYRRICILPEGPVVYFEGPLDTETFQPTFELRIRAVNGLKKYTMPAAWRNRARAIDILLSHETYKGRLDHLHPTGRLDGAGSEELREMIKRLEPAYHFFGHHHYYYPEIMVPWGNTTSIGMNQLNFGGNNCRGQILPGCFGILTVASPDDMTFEIVDDGWFNKLTYSDCIAFM